MGAMTPFIENNELIKEIEIRPVLWDVNHRKYNERFCTAAAWKVVAYKLKTEDKILKTKWKNLRDIYKREREKYSHTTQKYKGKWKYFQKMSFLKKIYSTNEESSPGNVQNIMQDDGYPIEFIVENDSDEQSSDELLSDDNDSKSEVSNADHDKETNECIRKHPNRGLSVDGDNQTECTDVCNTNSILELEEIAQDDSNESDSSIPVKRKKSSMNNDVMFLKSLTPYFKLLEPTRKLVLRNRIQDLLLKEIADQDSLVLEKPL